MSNYHSNYHDPMRQYSSASYTTNTDKTLFLTPYNQSIVSRSSASQDKSEKPERGSSKTKLTPDILRTITKIDNLNQIVEINLDGNSRHLKSRLKAISGLHSLMNLRELILSNNDIEKIENLNHLKNLHILNLSFNKITKIENISILKQLQVLDLSNNLIEEVPALISKNLNLVDLNLANNLLSDKSSIMNLKPLPKLTILDLTNNPIREIPGYPTFIYHLLKKLCKLDSKMTPNFSKAQANNYLTQTSKYSSLGGLPNQEEEEIPAEQPEHDENEENEIKISYEQRLLATQNRLNELNVLSNRVRLLSAEDISSNKYLKVPQRDTVENNKSTEQKNSTFLVNENTLYSVSEDTRLKSNPMGEDTLDIHVNTTGILGNVSANMKILDIPSPHGQTQGTVEGWNFSVQTPPPNSGVHRGGFFGQQGENTLRPSGIMTNLIRLSRGGLEDTNEKQQQQQPSTVKKGHGGARTPAENHKETGEIAERIQGLQSEIEQRISNYDRITNTFTTKRQDVLERVKSLDEVIQRIPMNNNNENISPELLSHVRDVLDLLEYQSENHMNFLLMLNHIHSKLEGEGSKNSKSQHDEALTVEDIDLTFNVLSQRIDEISSRLETLYTHIYKIISKFNNSNTPKKFSKPSPKNSLFSNIEAQFKDLSIQVDSLIKEEQTRTKTFTGLRGLYTNMWRLTKSLVHIWKQQEATLDMESHLIGKTSFADFLFTSPKEPQVDNFTSPQHVGDFAGVIDKENWGLASPDPIMGFANSQSQDHHRQSSSINERALKNVNTEESDRGGKLTPVSDLHRGQSKSPISHQQNHNRTSRTEFSARENIKSARDNKSGLMRHSSKFPDDFGFPTISDHGENASPKDGSFSRNVSGINRRESGHTNEILRGFSYLSSHRGTLQNEGNHKQEKPCINCAAKDSAMKFAQDEMLKAQREKLTLEMELGRLRSEIIGIQKNAEHEIARARSESIQLASIQDREKEEYSTALILLSEICNHNSTKLDEIRLRMLSMMEQNVADSSNPLKWLVKMQSSTVEDLIKANNEMQDRTKSILTDFQVLFKEKTPRNDSLYAIKDHFQLTQQSSTTRRDSHSKIPDEPLLQSNRENHVFKVEPIQIPSAFEPHEHHEENTIFEQNPTPTLNAIQAEHDNNPDRDSFRPRLEAPMLQKLKKHNSENDLRRVSSAAKENSIEGSVNQPVRAFHEIKELRNNKPKQASSFHMDQASLFPQFTLDIKPENLANGQVTFNKNSMRESENNSLGNTNLNQILFGCNSAETISELTRPADNPSNIQLPSESDLTPFQSSIKDSTPTTLTGGFSPFQSYKFMEYAKVSGNALSNLQENIAQHLIKNEKGDAGKHLKKINNNIHQYKGMRERVAEVIGRRSIKPSESAKKNSRTVGGTSTPVNQSASKYSSPSIASNRRATLDVKTPRGIEQQPKEYASVRHNVGVNRGQFKYNNVFRKPSNYPTTTGERGVNVNIKNFLSEGKRVLESPDVTNYHEKFDISSPYHPVYSSHGSQGMRVSDPAVGSQVNSVGRMSLGVHPIERNMHM